MSVKSVFKAIGKGIWQGYKIASPFLGFIPIKGKYGKQVGQAISIISGLVPIIEAKIPGPGRGIEKLQELTLEALVRIEAETGLNFNSPAGRALIKSVADAEVAALNAQALVLRTKEAVKQYMVDMKAPAIDDAPEPEVSPTEG